MADDARLFAGKGAGRCIDADSSCAVAPDGSIAGDGGGGVVAAGGGGGGVVAAGRGGGGGVVAVDPHLVVRGAGTRARSRYAGWPSTLDPKSTSRSWRWSLLPPVMTVNSSATSLMPPVMTVNSSATSFELDEELDSDDDELELDEELDDEFDEPESDGLADATHGVAASPAPMPRATANAPIRPIYLASHGRSFLRPRHCLARFSG